MAFLETPRTDAGNVTFLAGGNNIDDLSLEHSFHSPKKRQHGLLQDLRTQRGVPPPLAAPVPALSRRPEAQIARPTGEFTPLLKSASKRSLLAKGPRDSIATAAHARKVRPDPATASHDGARQLESSAIYASERDDSRSLQDLARPLRLDLGSSAASTPLAVPHSRGDRDEHPDHPSQLSLREQEKIIDAIEKENFRLKLKIHFLEKMLHDQDPNLNENALKENAGLRVDKVSLQRDLAKIQKQLARSERDAELLRNEYQSKQNVDRSNDQAHELQIELAALKESMRLKDEELKKLSDLNRTPGADGEVQYLREKVEDLGAVVREKDRLIESKEDEFDIINARLKRQEDIAEERLETAEEVERLEAAVETQEQELLQTREEAARFKRERDEANSERQDLIQKLQKECSPRMFILQVLTSFQQHNPSRPSTPSQSARETQLQQNVNVLEGELQRLKDESAELRSRLTHKSHELRNTSDQLDSATKTATAHQESLMLKVKSMQEEHDALSSQISDSRRLKSDLAVIADEKSLLQTRHDALTIESQNLQEDLAKSRREIGQLQGDLRREKDAARRSELDVRAEAGEDADRLTHDVERLEQQLRLQQAEATQQEERLQRQLRHAKHEKEDVAHRMAQLQQSLDLSKQAEHASLARRDELQGLAESEQQRHRLEEDRLKSRVEDLEVDCEDVRARLQQSLSNLKRAEAGLLNHSQNKITADKRIQALEDEVDVLQSALEEDASRAKEQVGDAKQHARNLDEQLQSVQRELSELKAGHEAALARLSQLTTREQERSLTQAASAATQGGLEGHQTERQKLERLQVAHAQALKENESFRSLQERDVELKSAHALALSQLDCLREEKKAMQEKLNDLEASLHRARSRHAASTSSAHIATRSPESKYSKLELSLQKQVKTLSKQKAELEELLHLAREDAAALEAGQGRFLSSRVQDLTSVRQSRTPIGAAKLKTFFAESRQSDQNALRRIADVQKLSEEQFASLEQHRAQLEARLSQPKPRLGVQSEASDDTAHSIPHLCHRIQELEDQLRSKSGDKENTAASPRERRDLHDMVKAAKLEAEELQLRLSESGTRLGQALAREDDLRSQVRAVRSESRFKQEQVAALSEKLHDFHLRYDRAQKHNAETRIQLEEEHNKLKSRLAKSVEDQKALETFEAKADCGERQHKVELRELSKQMQRLKTRYKRTESFREGLVFEKRFLQKQIEMFQACNAADLRLLERIGFKPDSCLQGKRTSLRSIAWMVVATVRIRGLSNAGSKGVAVKEIKSRRNARPTDISVATR